MSSSKSPTQPQRVDSKEPCCLHQDDADTHRFLAGGATENGHSVPGRSTNALITALKQNIGRELGAALAQISALERRQRHQRYSRSCDIREQCGSCQLCGGRRTPPHRQIPGSGRCRVRPGRLRPDYRAGIIQAVATCLRRVPAQRLRHPRCPAKPQCVRPSTPEPPGAASVRCPWRSQSATRDWPRPRLQLR